MRWAGRGMQSDSSAGHAKSCNFDTLNFYMFIDEALVILVGAGEFEGIGDNGLAFFHARDDVGAADPMGFGVVGLRPSRGMIRVGMIKADDVFATFAAFALNADQHAIIDVIPVVGRVGARITGARYGSDDATSVFFETAKQDTAAFVGIRFFAVAAK
jgi:hypothetical protein